ncbi:MAG: baeRF7 domain-containing protein [Coriobacteriia bacterium]
MDDLTIDRALQLARSRDGHHVSLFMPTRTFVPGSQEEDTTRLRNLLRQAAEDLVERGARPAKVEVLLAPARALIDDRPFWLRAEHGLALLLGPEGMHAFRLPARVPESVHVSDRYYMRPLLPHVESRGEYWLLFISQKKVRLYSGSREGLAQIPAAGLPSSLGEALRWDDFEKASLQFHVNTSAAGGRGTPIYHGNNDPDIKNELARFFRQIDRALRERLRDSRAPLVLAGVDYLIPIYRDVNTYPHLTGDAVIGNADIVPLPELHKKAVAVLRGLAEWETRQLTNQVEEAWGSPKTTPDPETIVAAAFVGRVDTLFLTDGGQWWGTYDAEAGRVAMHRTPAPGDEDLLDLAALQTLENGGAVVSLPQKEMPHGQTAIALLRY